ncbi:MAG: OmpH family outer membrane protein [Bacteroidota bacterium]
MLKKTSVLLFIIGFLVHTHSVAQVKIGYTNPARILTEIPEVASIDTTIAELVQRRDAELALKADSLQQELLAYEQVASSMTEEARASREQELLAKNEAFTNERQGYLNEVNQRRNQLMLPIIEQMNAAIKVVADRLQLDLVLNEGTSYGDAIIFYSGNERLDITDQVIAELKKS